MSYVCLIKVLCLFFIFNFYYSIKEFSCMGITCYKEDFLLLYVCVFGANNLLPLHIYECHLHFAHRLSVG